MNADEIKTILDEHAKWLLRVEGGKRADFSGADLKFAYLSCYDLSYADFSGADLKFANLSGSDLRSANLSGADLIYADLGDHLIRTWYMVEYNCQYINGQLKIGSREYTTAEWASFTEQQIRGMDGDKAVKFWHSFDFRHIMQAADHLDQQLKERVK